MHHSMSRSTNISSQHTNVRTLQRLSSISSVAIPTVGWWLFVRPPLTQLNYDRLRRSNDRTRASEVMFSLFVKIYISQPSQPHNRDTKPRNPFRSFRHAVTFARKTPHTWAAHDEGGGNGLTFLLPTTELIDRAETIAIRCSVGICVLGATLTHEKNLSIG